MADEDGEIRVNRAPVLTLWAAIVAERLGHDADAAITLGRAVAGASARVKARSIGLEEPHAAAAKPPPPGEPARTVRLLGREIPVADHDGSDHALDHGHPAQPGPARAYVEKALGPHLPAVRRAMEALADSLPPDKLNRTGFRLYEHFRPEVAPGTKGWGAKGVLDLARIRDAAA
ncbi:MAG: hypothetical protein ACRYGC_07330 [Janthinobacterium lividum]